MRGLGSHLLDEPHNAHHEASQRFKDGYWKFITLRMGSRSSYVRFEWLNDKKFGTRLRIELNPRKLRPEGFQQLSKVLDWKGGPFQLAALLDHAKLTRLDIAVDVVGAAVSEILINHKDQGKRSMYIGSDGLLETLFVHRRMLPQKQKYDSSGSLKKLKHRSRPYGAVLVKAYDRVRERKSLNMDGPFGECPVTRIEMVLARFTKWAPLKKLSLMDDRFEKIRAGMADSQTPFPNTHWRNYVSLRRSLTHQQACDTMGLQKKSADKFLVAYDVLNPNIIAKDSNWSGWAAGLKYVGLSDFVG
jgi:hypothetical protein